MFRWVYMKTMLYCILFTSTLMAMSSTNWLMIWASLELNLFSFVPLLLNKNSMDETEATINYFLSQAIGSTMMLISSMMMFTYHWLMDVSWMILMFSILLKMGVAPCHFWFPATMEKTNWTNCFLLTTWQKLAPLFILSYVIMPKSSTFMMTVIVGMNAMLGGIMGLSQGNLKKIMAYSSITHMGWALSGLTLHLPCLSIAYFIMYVIVASPLFLYFNSVSLNELSDLWNKQKFSPSSNLLISLMLLSMGGLPPLTGFLPKVILITWLMKFNSMILIFLILGSIMNLFFYLNISLNMMMSEQEQKMNYKDYIFSIFSALALSMFSLVILIL